MLSHDEIFSLAQSNGRSRAQSGREQQLTMPSAAVILRVGLAPQPMGGAAQSVGLASAAPRLYAAHIDMVLPNQANNLAQGPVSE